MRKYKIDLAVDEYRGPVDTIDPVTHHHRLMPASLDYWPRDEWALIAYDDVGMAFARRAAFPREAINQFELKVVPDAR